MSSSAAFIESDLGRELVTGMVMQMRAIRQVGWRKHLDLPSNDLMHEPKNLNRNFAMLRLWCVGDTWAMGDQWVGVSGTGDYFPPKGVDAYVLKSREGDYAVNMKAVYGTPDDCFEPARYHPACGNPECSEVPLLNALSHAIRRCNIASGTPAHLILLTERLPCLSCGRLFRQFGQDHPGLSLHLLYMFDHTDRAEERLSTDLDYLSECTFVVECIDPDDSGHTGPGGPGFAPPGFTSHSKGGIFITQVAPFSDDYVVTTPSDATKVPSRAPGSSSAHFAARIPNRAWVPIYVRKARPPVPEDSPLHPPEDEDPA
ncbi:hypothetical protein [Burkholderia lata]|uniref:Uncharacterized protein n=1 Tax=Burkholderia lata (strain ATCC 17760 / DSM 23089 / LMG 22485 / NCIMB 9086 / R18194 / 383) TaxID=482957 RepID=A0A6P2YC04_BURL3|nr:hypothetical protein [Burkholderia lata]VWD18088.1 hypothetical protein BLA18109_05729 [Burkholderia lata]